VEHWIQQALSAGGTGPAVFPAAFMLGILGALGSCCTLPVIGAVAGYAGCAQSLVERTSRRELLLVGLFFMIGTVLSLAALGAVSGFVGGLAGASLARYWRAAGGILLVLFGLAGLRLIPFEIPKVNLADRVLGRGVAGAMVYGLAVGGGTTTCSIGCNPLLLMAVGGAAAGGEPLMGAALLSLFALGYSLPLAAGLIGIGFGLGRLGSAARRVMPAVRTGFGVVLIAVGFYLLATA